MLPAFSAFTGGFALQPEADERVRLCAANRVFGVPGRT
jgi:hypothetical protein